MLQSLNSTMESMRTISLGDKSLLDNLNSLNPSDSCERSFAVNFIWRGGGEYPFTQWRDRAVFFDTRANFILYPIGGDTSPAELSELFAEFSAHSLDAKFVYDVPPDYPKKFPGVSEFFRVEESPDDFDYIYDAQKLLDLRGGILRKKRNHIKHFDSLNPNWTQEPITSANLPEARDFMESLAMPNEIQPLSRVFSFFGELPIDGIILRGENRKIAAAAIMGALNPQMYSVHFEKSDKNSEGAAQKIVSLESSHIIGKGASLMNREQDLGLENLRKAKHSLDPLLLYKRLKLVPLFK